MMGQVRSNRVWKSRVQVSRGFVYLKFLLLQALARCITVQVPSPYDISGAYLIWCSRGVCDKVAPVHLTHARFERIGEQRLGLLSIREEEKYQSRSHFPIQGLVLGSIDDSV